MAVIPRQLKRHLEGLFRKYPVVTVTGPRQSGKTTLCRKSFPDFNYVNLEVPESREFALEDPRGFLRVHGEETIIDEIQRVPDLVSYLQAAVDERGKNGLYVLTGSQQFRVSQSISQSLAGRTALLRLLPLSVEEVLLFDAGLQMEDLLFRGFYPRIYDQQLDPTQALGDYFETYVERDVRQISQIRNLSRFQKFVRLCAGRTGNLLNLQSLSDDAGVSPTTVSEWISVLEASYILFRLPPYFANITKRLVKTPKLYFYDVGLACYLMGIDDKSQLAIHPLKGALFENLVVAEVLKYRFNNAKRSNLHFYRDSRGHEIDLICSLADGIAALEAKSAATLSKSFFKPFHKLREVLKKEIRAEVLVYAGDDHPAKRQGVQIANPFELASLLRRLPG